MLGFEVQHIARPDDDPGWAKLRRGDIVLMLNTEEEKGNRRPEQDRSRSGYVAFYLHSPDLDAAHRHVTELGASPTPIRYTYYGWREFTINDPDGYEFVFNQPAGDPDGSEASKP